MANLRAYTALPPTRPAGVDTSDRLRHKVYFTDAGSTTSKARPAGARGCQVWLKLIAPHEEPPVDPAELHYTGTATRPGYIIDFDGKDACKNACYMLRWENTRGETGPWSAVVVATVTA